MIKHKYQTVFTNDGEDSEAESALVALAERASKLAYDYGIIRQDGITPNSSDDNFMSELEAIQTELDRVGYGSSAYGRNIRVSVSDTRNMLNRGKKIKMARKKLVDGEYSTLANFYIDQQKIFTLGGVTPKWVNFWLEAVENLFLHKEYFRLYDADGVLVKDSLEYEEIAFFMLKGYDFSRQYPYYNIRPYLFLERVIYKDNEKTPSPASLTEDVTSDDDFIYNTLK